jgi:hypothetical protein
MKKAKVAAGYGIIKGILWHQGETNCKYKQVYKNYKTKTGKFFIQRSEK